MRRFSQSLQEEMEQRLRAIRSQEAEPLKQSLLAIEAMTDVIERLKTFAISYDFAGIGEEIYFFREVKPRFAAGLIYYTEVYYIEVSRPVGDGKELRRHYKSQMAKLNSFFADNLEFYRYYRSGDTEMDLRYFVRTKPDYRAAPDKSYIMADHRFTTSHDYKLACMLANEELKTYLEERLSENTIGGPSALSAPVGAKWTAPKVALVELAYALHAAGVFNHGTLALKDIIHIFESLGNLSLGQYHKTFLEIRERKSERARFLSALRDAFEQRMECADDF